MGGTEKRMFFGILALLMLVAALYLYQSLAVHEVDVYGISVILCGDGVNFEKGLNGAALESNADLHIVRVSDPSAAAQTAALERELKNGADAVILWLADAEGLSPWLAKNISAAPLVLVGDGALSLKGVSLVSLDAAAQAEALAEEMKKQPLRSAAVVEGEEEGKEEEARLAALLRALGEAGFTFELLKAGEVTSLSSGTVYAAPGPSAAQALSEVWSEGALLYGMGYGASLRGPLESGRITALAIVSEFDAGYLAVTEAVSRIDGRRAADAALTPFIARPDNMYEPPVSTILFPIG